MLQEFKDFINKGNVIDLAVAVVLAAAFAPVVGAIVDRVLMPLVGLLVGQPNFDTLVTFACTATPDDALILNAAGEYCAGSVGAVITAIINFLLIGLAVFFVVKAYNRATAEAEDDAAEEEAPAEEPEEIIVLREIRDAVRGTGLPPTS